MSEWRCKILFRWIVDNGANFPRLVSTVFLQHGRGSLCGGGVCAAKCEHGGKIWVANDGTWIYTDNKGRSVAFPNGYPDFATAGYVRQSEWIERFVNRDADKRAVRKELAKKGIVANKKGYDWHHVEDMHTMQWVATEIHGGFTHQGGNKIAQAEQRGAKR